MNESFWRTRWENRQIAFHREGATPALVDLLPRLESGGAPRRVLVPLCGKSVDMTFLATQGLDVVGVEFVASAAEEYFRERGLTPERRAISERVTSLSGGGVCILVGDIFDIAKTDVGDVTAVFDRAALIALPKELQKAYVEHISSLTAPGATLLLITLEYAGDSLDGPPFSVSAADVKDLYEKFGPGELVSECDLLESPDEARWKARGATLLRERTWLFTRAS